MLTNLPTIRRSVNELAGDSPLSCCPGACTVHRSDATRTESYETADAQHAACARILGLHHRGQVLRQRH